MRRIAVTGGPGAGKTTLWREIIAEHGERIVAVPEVATLLLRHVFPPVLGEHERRAVQRSIFRVQQDIEAVHEARLTPGQVLLCDRGTPDGGGYWLLGLTRADRAVFDDVPMSNPTTHRAQIRQLHRRGFSVTTTASLRDVDTSADADLVAAATLGTPFATHIATLARPHILDARSALARTGGGVHVR